MIKLIKFNQKKKLKIVSYPLKVKYPKDIKKSKKFSYVPIFLKVICRAMNLLKL